MIVAAGSSRRMGFDKLEADLMGSPVAVRSILAFEQSDVIGEIIVVTQPSKVASLEALGISKLRAAVVGGAERHDSVWAGIQACSSESEFVAVHDGARPLVSSAAIALTLDAAQSHGAASLAHRVTETLKRGNSDQWAGDPVSREDLWAMETPQIFRRDLLFEAYTRVRDQGALVTDEVSAMEFLGQKVKLVENPGFNPKITVPADLEVAAAIMSKV
ncbi:MAG: IspD/TarI family cytidylyltransferase [Verrucomicrobiota bacterium]